MTQRFAARPYLLSFALLLSGCILSIMVGSVVIPAETILKLFLSRLKLLPQFDESLLPFATIIFSLRLPRTMLMVLTGAALGGSGAAYQGLFQNPLADPYLIGVASGAGLGAVIAMSINWPYSSFSFFIVPAAAFSGALLTVFIVYQMARIRRTVPTTNLILAGVAVGAFATSVTSFLMLNATDEVRRAIAWLLGGATHTGWMPVFAMLPYTLLGLGFIITSGHALNVLQFGDEQAQQLGLNVRRIRFLVIVTASLATAAAVSFTGIIGFIGLIVPHSIRLIWGGDYRKLLPLAVINGATLLLLSDILSRVLIPPQEIPVGIITALGGAPFFLWILRKAKQQHYW